MRLFAPFSILALLVPSFAQADSLDEAAAAFETGISHPCDPDAFNSRVDFTPTVRTVSEEIEFAREDHIAVFLDGLHRVDFGAAFCADSGEFVEFDLIKAERGNEKLGATYRRRGDDGVNYIKIFFEEHENRVVISDFWNYISAVRVSENIKDGLAQVARKTDQNVVTRVFSYGQSWVDFVGRQQKILAHIKEGEFGKAHLELARVPEKIRDGHHFLLIQFQLAVAEENWEYRIEVSEKLAAFSAEKPEVDLVVLDARIENGDWDAAEEGLLRLRAHLGDPYIDVIRANVQILAGNLEVARTAADAALSKDEPWGLWPLLSLEILADDLDSAFDVLERMRRDLDVTPIEVWATYLAGDEPFMRFVESRRFKKWRKRADKEILRQTADGS